MRTFWRHAVTGLCRHHLVRATQIGGTSACKSQGNYGWRGFSTFTNSSIIFRGVNGRLLNSTVFNCRRSSSDILPVSVQKPVPEGAIISNDGERLTIRRENEADMVFNSTWLRYQCHCEKCKQPNSGQRLIAGHSLPQLLSIKSAEVAGDFLNVTWTEDEHVGQIPLDVLRENSYTDRWLFAYIKASTPTPLDRVPEINYDALISDKKHVFRWLSDIASHGLSLVRDVPTQLETVRTVAELIAPVQNTIYGEIFDVLNTENPINIAYSADELGFHADLVYYESPPGLQLLHCIR